MTMTYNCFGRLHLLKLGVEKCGAIGTLKALVGQIGTH
jgi:hypothetical protein